MGLTRLNWILILLTLMEINCILKMIVFGSGLFTNDVINLKHQGACQKLMIGWYKHQGVSETPKNADVICEQPLRSFFRGGQRLLPAKIQCLSAKNLFCMGGPIYPSVSYTYDDTTDTLCTCTTSQTIIQKWTQYPHKHVRSLQTNNTFINIFLASKAAPISRNVR